MLILEIKTHTDNQTERAVKMEIELPPNNVPDAKQIAVQALYALIMNTAEAASNGHLPDHGEDSLTKLGVENVIDTIIHLAKVAARENACPLCDDMRESVKKRFDRYATEWREATGHMSITRDSSMHPAYQRIIGLGPVVVPILIEQLRIKASHWFWALGAIIGEDKAANAMTVPEAAQQWIEWYDNHWTEWCCSSERRPA